MFLGVSGSSKQKVADSKSAPGIDTSSDFDPFQVGNSFFLIVGLVPDGH